MTRPSRMSLVLPTPTDTYNLRDQRETRRAIELAFQKSGASSTSTLPWFDPTDYGTIGGGDDTAAIQGAIDAATAVGGGYVLLAANTTYLVDVLTIKNGVRLIGAGAFQIEMGVSASTVIQAIAGSTSRAVLLLDEGPVQNVELGGFSLLGNGNAGQIGAYFRAVATLSDGVLQGGLWFFQFHDLTIHNFAAEQLWLSAGDEPHNAPHQFGTFSRVQTVASTTHAGLRLSGQVGQVDFDAGCRMVGPGRNLGTVSVKIERSVDDAGVNLGDVSPYTINFNSTIELNTRLVSIERAQGVNFRGAHFEEASEGIHTDVAAICTLVSGCVFGNVGSDGSGTGFAVKNVGGSITTVENNSFIGTTERHYVGQGTSSPLYVQGSQYDATGIRNTNIITSGVLAPVFISTSGTVVLTTGTELCNATGGAITRTLPAAPAVAAGTRITIKKYDGSANAVTIAGSPDGTTYALSKGNQFIECEWDGGGWKVIGMSVPTQPITTAGFLSASATNVTPWGFQTQAKFDAAIDLLDKLYAACEAHGLVV